MISSHVEGDCFELTLTGRLVDDELELLKHAAADVACSTTSRVHVETVGMTQTSEDVARLLNELTDTCARRGVGVSWSSWGPPDWAPR